MVYRKSFVALVILWILTVGLTSSLYAEYYLDTLFPIGLTGLNGTGGTPPYSNVDPYWTWSREQDLIFDLGINCIGAEDAKPTYLLDFNPESTSVLWANNYLHKVCKPLTDAGDSANPEHIYIIEFIDITELIDTLLIDSLPDSLNLED